MERLKDMEDLCTQKETFMKVIGLRIKLTVLESTHITTVRNSQEIGYLINNKDMEKNNGQMVLNMKVIIKKE